MKQSKKEENDISSILLKFSRLVPLSLIAGFAVIGLTNQGRYLNLLKSILIPVILNFTWQIISFRVDTQWRQETPYVFTA